MVICSHFSANLSHPSRWNRRLLGFFLVLTVTTTFFVRRLHAQSDINP